MVLGLGLSLGIIFCRPTNATNKSRGISEEHQRVKLYHFLFLCIFTPLCYRVAFYIFVAFAIIFSHTTCAVAIGLSIWTLEAVSVPPYAELVLALHLLPLNFPVVIFI